MKVRNVISLAAASMGREDLVAMAENCAAEPAGELASLLRCYNLVENEVALDYFPLKRRERFSVCGVLPFSEFSSAPVEILEVKREDGGPLSYDLRPDALAIAGGTGEISVLYTYVPKEKEWGDDAETAAQISRSVSRETGTASSLEPVGKTAPTPR